MTDTKLPGRSSIDESHNSGEDEVVEPDQGNGKFPLRAAHQAEVDFLLVLSHIISQLRPGADLSRVVLPTFILEPRSMLERITKYVLRIPVLRPPHLKCFSLFARPG